MPEPRSWPLSLKTNCGVLGGLVTWPVSCGYTWRPLSKSGCFSMGQLGYGPEWSTAHAPGEALRSFTCGALPAPLPTDLECWRLVRGTPPGGVVRRSGCRCPRAVCRDTDPVGAAARDCGEKRTADISEVSPDHLQHRCLLPLGLTV